MGRTHADDVAIDAVAEGEVAGECNKNVDAAGGEGASCDYARCLGWGVVFDFVQNGEHLAVVELAVFPDRLAI